ncbi:MAG: nitroreductase family protein [Promethearchaeota archaeon]
MDFAEVIEKRRSVRKYKTDPVPDEILNKVLEAARIAPSWSNLQCWKYIVIKDENTKKALADALPSGNPVKGAFTQAPIIIAGCADPERSGYIGSQRIGNKQWHILDLGISMQQLVLAATNEGLGTCWVCWFSEKKIKDILKAPDNIDVVALTPLGFPGEEPKTKRRNALEEIVYFEQYGRSK